MGFRVGVPLEGDIVIALWFGAVVRDTDAPALAYAFHTAFAAPGVLRVEPRDLTVSRCITLTTQLQAQWTSPTMITSALRQCIHEATVRCHHFAYTHGRSQITNSACYRHTIWWKLVDSCSGTISKLEAVPVVTDLI